jgi:hypothetical protein
MINYSYFRHRFDAHQNAKLNRLVDEIGIEAYAYYYTLIELYGSHYHKLNDKNEVEIHQRIIANVWRKRVDSCHLVITKLVFSGLLVATKTDATYLLTIPNFLKYFGSYKKTKHLNTSNKRKENKIKEKEIKEKENAQAEPYLTIPEKPKINIEDSRQSKSPENLNIDHAADLFNSIVAKGKIKKALMGQSPKTREQFLNMCGNPNFRDWDQWRSYFNEISKSDFLSRGEKFSVDFTWVINLDNAMKVIQGLYQNRGIAQEDFEEKAKRLLEKIKNNIKYDQFDPEEKKAIDGYDYDLELLYSPYINEEFELKKITTLFKNSGMKK